MKPVEKKNSDIIRVPSEECELTDNSLGAHIETHGGLKMDTQLPHSELTT